MADDYNFQTVHQLTNMIFSALEEKRYVNVFVLLQHRSDCIDRILQMSKQKLSHQDIERAYLDTQHMIERIKYSLDQIQESYQAYISNINAHRAYMMAKIGF